MAMFMIYLIMFIVLTQAVAAGAVVKQSTGDLSVSMPLMTVPGTGGMSFPITMSYSGAGIKMDQGSSWVGLGFSLSAGSITRSVVNLPDDATNDQNNVWMKYWSEGDFDQAWWRTALDWIFIFIVVVITIFLIFITWGTGTPLWLEIAAAIIFLILNVATQLYFTGTVDWSSVGEQAVISAFTIGLPIGVDKLANVEKLANHAETIVRVGNFLGCAATAYSIYKAVDSYGGSKDSGKDDAGDNFDNLVARDGYLRAPFYQEAYDTNNDPLHDGGSPDNWNLGGPLSGNMIIADETTHARHSDINDAKFFLENAPSTENTNIEYDLNADGHIVRFIVTSNDGTRYIYGDNQDDALVWSFSSGSYVYYEQDYSDGGDTSSFKSRTMNMFFEPHVVEWKLTAILAPDYVDGSSTSDYNPYDADEANNKGSWIAFTYNKVYYYGPDSPNCGFNVGNTYDGGFVWISEYNNDDDGTRMKYGGVTELTYLANIVTPTHIAEFNISLRADGREKDSSWYYSDSKGPHGFNFDVGNFCQNNNVGCLSSTYYCIGTHDGVDYPYKLDSIDLKVRINNEPLAVVKFNNGATGNEQYALKPSTPGNAGVYGGGVYTLNHLDVCDKYGLDCKRAEFYY